MKATETTLAALLSGKRQYQIPIFQRSYSWGPKQFRQLWDDIAAIADEEEPNTHFIGAVMLSPAPGFSASFPKWWVVDGQQRLTTLTVLLAALRDHLIEHGEPDAEARISEQYLINKFVKTSDDRYRLLSSRNDRKAYMAVIDRQGQEAEHEGPGEAYHFFRARLVEADDPDDAHDIERIEDAILARLAVVEISADAADNVHRIFESLNNTGLGLTQADLLRNYIFMRLPVAGELAYEQHWLPFENMFSPKELEDLIWIDLLLHGHTRARQDATYQLQQERLAQLTDEDAIVRELESLGQRAKHFHRVLNPNDDGHEIDEKLGLLNRWGNSSTHAFSVRVLEQHDAGTLDVERCVRALSIIESFVVRRMIAGVSSSALTRQLREMVAELDDELPLDEAIERHLSVKRRYWPTDEQLTEAILNEPFYWRGRGTQRSYVLQRLEQSFGSKEPVDFAKLTIEHVMPQTMSDRWWHDLRSVLPDDVDAAAEHERLVHTLGNLSLTGYNSALSNNVFEAKRDQLRTSGLHMNHEIADQQQWGPTEIESRSRQLAQRCIEIWPGPIELGDEGPSTTQSSFALRMQSLLQQLPAGAWTSYGDIAAVLGSSAMGVASACTSPHAPDAYRVLTSDGTVAPDFKWHDTTRTDDPVEMLRSIGVIFLDNGKASPGQRMAPRDLALLIGLDFEEEQQPDAVADSTEFDEVFLRLYGPSAFDGLSKFLDAWRSHGGQLAFGATQKEPVLRLRHEPFGHSSYGLWCGAIYPASGGIEVWFQHLKRHQPFDEEIIRNEFRRQLNQANGVDIAEAKLALRPSIDLEVLADPIAVEALIDAFGYLPTIARQRLRGSASA